MKVIVLEEKGQFIGYCDFEVFVFVVGEVVVYLKVVVFNYWDVWIIKGMYLGIKMFGILGFDGVGIVEGWEVIINLNIGWGDKQEY